MLHEKQIQAAKLYSEGMKPIDIAKVIGISRQSFYDWMKKEEFTSELDRLTNEMKAAAEQTLTNNVERYIKELEVIAFTGRSEKNRTDALTYLLDRVLGKSTTKVQDITEASNTNASEVSWDSEKDSNILELKTGN